MDMVARFYGNPSRVLIPYLALIKSDTFYKAQAMSLDKLYEVMASIVSVLIP